MFSPRFFYFALPSGVCRALLVSPHRRGARGARQTGGCWRVCKRPAFALRATARQADRVLGGSVGRVGQVRHVGQYGCRRPQTGVDHGNSPPRPNCPNCPNFARVSVGGLRGRQRPPKTFRVLRVFRGLKILSPSAKYAARHPRVRRRSRRRPLVFSPSASVSSVSSVSAPTLRFFVAFCRKSAAA